MTAVYVRRYLMALLTFALMAQSLAAELACLSVRQVFLRKNFPG